MQGDDSESAFFGTPCIRLTYDDADENSVGDDDDDKKRVMMSPLALMLLSLLMVTLNLNCHAAASQKSLGSEGGGDKQRQAVWSGL